MVTMDEEVREGLDIVTKKLVPLEKFSEIANELVTYHNKDPTLFREGLAMTVIHTTHPRVWWEMFGSSVPVLQSVAIKILSQPCSASACERNWSAFDATNTKKRNNLAPSRLTNLVFIRMNMFAKHGSRIEEDQ
ncbi:hypothetical protein EJ110_NYTH49114 [Nymphaea thermarum]|nr:hypothetical protein EJ110_NYTH49114 [Nymphaea thermarum]